MHRAWSRTQRLSGDSWQLLWAVWNAAPGSGSMGSSSAQVDGRRAVLLLKHAENNAAAVKLLQWEREVNLLRYYGPRGYWKEKKLVVSSVMSRWLPTKTRLAWFSTRTAAGDDSANSESNAVTKATSPRVAKVPFMITARMRQDLLLLGYEVSQIASQTPVHAMLILEHKVTPDQVDQTLPELVKSYEAEQQKAAEEAIAARKQQEEQLMLLKKEKLDAAEAANEVERPLHTSPVESVEFEQPSSSSSSTSSSASTVIKDSPDEPPLALDIPLQPATLSTAESNLVDAPWPAETSSLHGTTWHQVVEIVPPSRNPDTATTTISASAPSVVGMFLDRKEAEFARGVHQDLANERAADTINSKRNLGGTSTFEVRTVVKE